MTQSRETRSNWKRISTFVSVFMIILIVCTVLVLFKTNLPTILQRFTQSPQAIATAAYEQAQRDFQPDFATATAAAQTEMTKEAVRQLTDQRKTEETYQRLTETPGFAAVQITLSDGSTWDWEFKRDYQERIVDCLIYPTVNGTAVDLAEGEYLEWRIYRHANQLQDESTWEKRPFAERLWFGSSASGHRAGLQLRVMQAGGEQRTSNIVTLQVPSQDQCRERFAKDTLTALRATPEFEAFQIWFTQADFEWQPNKDNNGTVTACFIFVEVALKLEDVKLGEGESLEWRIYRSATRLFDENWFADRPLAKDSDQPLKTWFGSTSNGHLGALQLLVKKDGMVQRSSNVLEVEVPSNQMCIEYFK